MLRRSSNGQLLTRRKRRISNNECPISIEEGKRKKPLSRRRVAGRLEGRGKAREAVKS